ncbi:Glutamine synthetase 1, mitochondrial [Geodia barretti]|nr:Glutamine synthetase 1, mitochondrial [Geodia barretti]
MCETYAKDGTPHPTNKRYSCDRIMERVMDEENPEFAIEQEYTLLDYDGHPFGWPKSGYPGQQGPYYCAVGATNVFGRQVMEEAIQRLEKRHKEHIILYDPSGGVDNSRRLTGLHETAHIDQFFWGVAHRGASIRIPRGVAQAGRGYLEDRRPSSNGDPYLVCEALVRTAVLDDWTDFDWTN